MVPPRHRSVPHRRLAKPATPSKTKPRAQANRRKINWPRRVLISSLLALVVECLAVAYLSPRFYLTRLDIKGLETLAPERIQSEISWAKTQNLFLAPTGKWERNLLRVPGVAHVSVQRMLPGTIRAVVEERRPWASVHTIDGSWHTIDSSYVPFRRADKPEAGLPHVVVSDVEPWEVLPGVRIPSETLEAAHTCILWAQAHPAFPITQIEIDRDAKVYLIRAGKVPVQLGTGDQVDAKLKSLENLLQVRPELSHDTNVAYISLVSADAPAIGAKKWSQPKPRKIK